MAERLTSTKGTYLGRILTGPPPRIFPTAQSPQPKRFRSEQKNSLFSLSLSNSLFSYIKIRPLSLHLVLGVSSRLLETKGERCRRARRLRLSNSDGGKERGLSTHSLVLSRVSCAAFSPLGPLRHPQDSRYSSSRICNGRLTRTMANSHSSRCLPQPTPWPWRQPPPWPWRFGRRAALWSWQMRRGQ